jgi:hypothetical protein
LIDRKKKGDMRDRWYIYFHYILFTKASSWSIRLCNSTFSFLSWDTRSSNSRIFVW